MKKKAIAAAIILAVLLILSGVVYAVRERGARTPVITVKEYGMAVQPGDTVDTGELVEVTVKGDYKCGCEILYGQEYCDIDENGILRVVDGGQSAMGTICLEYSAAGSANRSCSERVYIDVKNPIGENNSYETSASDIRLRMYNNLDDVGNGVFRRGEGQADNDYEVIVHSSAGAKSLDGLEAEIRSYAKEKYSIKDDTNDYTSEDATLPSGKKARKITFLTVRSEGKYLPYENSSGTVERVVIYAFALDGRCFFIEDNNPWCSEYELEQIAGTVS